MKKIIHNIHISGSSIPRSLDTLGIATEKLRNTIKSSLGYDVSIQRNSQLMYGDLEKGTIQKGKLIQLYQEGIIGKTKDEINKLNKNLERLFDLDNPELKTVAQRYLKNIKYYFDSIKQDKNGKEIEFIAFRHGEKSDNDIKDADGNIIIKKDELTIEGKKQAKNLGDKLSDHIDISNQERITYIQGTHGLMNEFVLACLFDRDIIKKNNRQSMAFFAEETYYLFRKDEKGETFLDITRKGQTESISYKDFIQRIKKLELSQVYGKLQLIPPNDTNLFEENISQEENEVVMNLLNNKLQKITYINNIQHIPKLFNKIPSGYINNIAHRGNYSEQEMQETLEDGTKKILHLDIDIGKTCKLSCPHCFKNNKELQKIEKKELSLEELKEIVLKFKKLGLKTVKICGAGEPFDNKDFIPFLEFLYLNGIKSSVFTKGYVNGNDEIVKKLYGDIGINSGEELAHKLKKLDVSILLSLNSFDEELQKQYSGALKGKISKSYIKNRDKALIDFINAGLNEFKIGEPTRLAIIMAPMKPENLNEIKKIYTWARMRNIYPLGCPTNESGLGIKENKKIKIEYPKYIDDLIQLYTDIYIWNIDNGITTLKQLEKEGISLYPGCHPCTQTNIGGYLNLYGELLSCPGHDPNRDNLKISKNIVKEESLVEMRKKSKNYKRSGFNQKCIARDGSSIPSDFYDKIMQNLQIYYTNNHTQN